ncbi:MAG TPA: L,D-transpeptidase [Polyangia bacterium]|nr:L,D-transpeptidase [Polyangia bacterium]
MRRHFASCTAALAASIVPLGMFAGVAVADGPAPAGALTTAVSTATNAAAAATINAATTTSSATPTTTTPTTTTPTKPSKPTTPAKPTTPTPPAAAKATAKLYLADTFTVSKDEVTVPGRVVEVQGFVRPYVVGQKVKVQSFLGSKLIKTDVLRIKPVKGGIGAFTEKVSASAAGPVRVKVTHARTPQMLGFLSERAFTVLNPQAGFGARSTFVTLIQERLNALHIFVPQSGVYDTYTGLALDAYHRLLGHGFSQSLDGATVSELLNGVGTFHVRYPRDGTHVEGDLSRQLLAEINGSKVIWIYPISSGKPSTPTVLGRFQVYYRVPGYLPDGMYFSSFFFRGYAIHGYDPAPDFPASHGCMRLPIIDAISVFNWVKMGDWVDVYYE